MSINSEEFYSALASQNKASAVQEILKLLQKPEIISLAGGLPDPATFPAEEIRKIINHLLITKSAQALQYSSTQGLPGLRQSILDYLSPEGIKGDLENIIISSGSQQGLDLVGKLFLNPGDVAIVELPSYLAALDAFCSYGGKLVGIPMDEEGMQMDLLKEKLTQLQGEGKKVKFIYTISNFQNPAGVTMSLPRRQKILEIAKRFNLFIIEDNPYEKLRFEGTPLPSIYSLDREGRVISLGTFSKILCPGLRLAWMLGNKEVIYKFTLLKQATDLCTNILSQLIAYKYFQLGRFDENIQSNIDIYRQKRDVMFAALAEYFPPETSWTKPQGGFFVMATLPEYIDTQEMLIDAIKENVAYVPGSPFFADGQGKNTMRLSFCYPSSEDIKEGIKRIGKVIKKKIRESPVHTQPPKSS
ncbi:MAG: PLP-dependent aminotransferase family protein [Atribacterota bacterium]|nr:PLP-dependent aminotransferase family protein [Atribacterota bacterium]